MLEELCPPCRGLISTIDKPSPGECIISGENITASWTNVCGISTLDLDHLPSRSTLLAFDIMSIIIMPEVCGCLGIGGGEPW